MATCPSLHLFCLALSLCLYLLKGLEDGSSVHGGEADNALEGVTLARGAYGYLKMLH